MRERPIVIRVEVADPRTPVSLQKPVVFMVRKGPTKPGGRVRWSLSIVFNSSYPN
jgi:hypothetical protein